MAGVGETPGYMEKAVLNTWVEKTSRRSKAFITHVHNSLTSRRGEKAEHLVVQENLGKVSWREMAIELDFKG